MKKQYILFDLDGTLTDPAEGITKSVQYALKHFGIEEDDLLVFYGVKNLAEVCTGLAKI